MRVTTKLTLLAVVAAFGCGDGTADPLIGLDLEPLHQRAVVLDPDDPLFIGDHDENENLVVCVKFVPEGEDDDVRRVIVKDDFGDRDGDGIPDCPGGFELFPGDISE